MLFKTYQKITTLFKEHHGYMSFADLRDHQVTVLQLAEMDLENFEIRRFYFQNADVPGEICEKKTEFGSYKYYSPKRTFCDCLRMNNKMPEEVKEEILTWCRKQKYSKEEILEYANRLRAVKNIEEEYQK